MTDRSATHPPAAIGPPSKHQLALMIWLAVFPTLTMINLALGDWIRTLSPVLRTLVLATIAVPIVIYGVMPHLHRVRVRIMARRSGRYVTATAITGDSQRPAAERAPEGTRP